MALSAPAAPGSSPFDLPWTLTGGRGILGLDPIHGALAVFGALMGVTLLFLITSALMTRWQWGRLNRREATQAAADRELVRLTPLERARLRADAGELIRQAAVTAAAAKRAKAEVAEMHTVCEVAQRAREQAWIAFDKAQRAYETSLREAAAKTAQAAPAADDTETVEVTKAILDAAVKAEADKAQKREMCHAALEAFKRGDITVDELNAVFKQATGWDPLLELQAREVELRRAAESRARRLYQAAAAAERAAVQAADVAEVAARALAEESVEMGIEAEAAREELVAAMRAGDPEEQPAKRKVPKQRGRDGVGKPAVSKPAVGKPAVGKPAVGKPAVSKPVGTKPAVSKPAAGKPAAGKPGSTKSVASKPAASKPSMPKPPALTSPAQKASAPKPVVPKPAGGDAAEVKAGGDQPVAPVPAETPAGEAAPAKENATSGS